jgi:hypothetical protein
MWPQPRLFSLLPLALVRLLACRILVTGQSHNIVLNLNVASGLLWLSEVIEEHSRTSKLVGVRATYVRFPRRPRILPCSDLRFLFF